MDLKEFFKKFTGYNPYNFQIECIEELTQGGSLIVRAPTGSGKSEVAFISFLHSKNEQLPPQMIYSLPTRTLIDNLSNRALKYATFKNQSIATHHGKRVESPLFDEDIIVTTIDQTVGAYVCTPLSAPLRRGNIFAGGVSSAFLVFDEIHTFDPQRGLQTALTLIEHSSKLNIPVCVMSATLPSKLIEKMYEILNKYHKVKTEDVEDESEIKSRKSREVVLHIFDQNLSPDIVVNIYNTATDKKLIVICNTVNKAQQLFKGLYKDYQNKILRDEISDAKLILIHSRFLDDDRKEKEEKIQRLFSKESKDKVILITTQVIEVGIDISANTVVSEIAPIDSLVQRAGRCARWGGRGDFYVFGTEDYGPYGDLKDVVEKTREELKKNNGTKLTWELERNLVDNILTDYYTHILDDTNRYALLGTLARAVYEGNKTLAEKTVREIYSCGVSIHDNPTILGNDVAKLQKVNVNVFVFKCIAKKLIDEGKKIWVIEENNILSDYDASYTVAPVKDSSEILPFKNYIVGLESAKYNKEIGLVFGEMGDKEFEKVEDKTFEENQRELCMKKETWIEHAIKTLDVLDRYFLPRYDYIVKRFSEAFGIDKQDLIEKIRIATALHDIGKLNIEWQKKIGWDGKEPLAHSDREDIIQIGIPHATVSAVALSKVFRDWGDSLGIPFYLAVAHHHSPRAMEYSRYTLIDNWEEVIWKVVGQYDLIKDIIDKRTSGRIEIPAIDISDEQNVLPYRFYTFISKVIRLSDWLATGGEKSAVLYS